ncbi:MAG: HAD-IIB family hydrolase [Oscillospiraceae bacterium]|nr:HAD-IIB family hydrolase [Oscillospiraceae bacterium]
MTDTLYVTDLDGTLLQPDVSVSDKSFRILSELLEDGLPLTAATARTSFSVMPILRGLPLKLPLILQNGAVLHDPVTDSVVSAAVIKPDAFLQVLELFSQFRFNGFVFCVPGSRLECCYTELTTEHMRRYYQERRDRYDKPFKQVASLCELNGYNPVFLSLNAPKERLDPLHAALQELRGISVAYYRDVYEPGIWYLEVTAPDASKYHGICRLKEITGAKTVVGFGDNHNDFPLFRACDVKIAVGNAAEELKAQADIIIGRNTDDAVAEYLYSVFKIRYSKHI